MALENRQADSSSNSKPSAFRSLTISDLPNPASLELSIWFNSLVSRAESKEFSISRTLNSQFREAVKSAKVCLSRKIKNSPIGRVLGEFEISQQEISSMYKVLLKQYLNSGASRTHQAETLLSNHSFLHSLLALCLELYLFVKDETRIDFEQVLEYLNVSIFDFWKLVSYFAAFESFIPAPLLFYFKTLNYKILTESAWKGSSDFFKTVFFAFSSYNNKTAGKKRDITGHSYTQFFKKLTGIIARRIHMVCSEIGLNEEVQEIVWTLTRHFLSEYTEYLKDHNVEIVILCGINATCKMKCEIPLVTLFHKYKEVTGLERFVTDSKIDEATAVSQFYNNVYLILLKKFLNGDLRDTAHRIDALYPTTPLKDCLPYSSPNEVCHTWMTPRTMQLINLPEQSSPKSRRRILFDDYLQPNKKAKFN